LDEPVAGINPETIEKIFTVIKKLSEEGKTVVMIEHNIDAVMQVCDRVIFMDEGKKIAEGDPESVRNNPAVIEAYLE
jgi:ABC-type branched-subunit amino acid transport system ATPase component